MSDERHCPYNDAMEVLRGVHNLRDRHHGCALTIGNFDGVHRGHQALLAHLRKKAQTHDSPSLVITFEPQPREYLGGTAIPPRLTRFREKIVLLEELGIDRVLCLPFNEQTSRTPATWVVDELIVKRLGARYVLVGDDFRFGQGAQGNFAMLARAGERAGFECEDLGTLAHAGERVSSTRIREALRAADFGLAEALLGRPYFIMGRVVYGRQLGRQLGVPTANIQLRRYRSALEGVYAVTVEGIADRAGAEGIANIGVRPTVDGKEPLLEVHVFDYSGDLYGQLLTVTFHHKLRDERAFDGLEALKAQIARDLDEARGYFVRRHT